MMEEKKSMERKETSICFLGTDTYRPTIGNDTASFIINRHILVDTGWNVVRNLNALGFDPKQIDYLLFTHMHHDHYLSLPSILFELLMTGKKMEELKIIGPEADVELVVQRALDFLQAERFFSDRGAPTVIPLKPGSSFEGEDFTFRTSETLHPVQGMCYRFSDKATGKIFSFTGDTAYHPPLADLIRGSSLLITEASRGPGKVDMSTNKGLHSGAGDAAELAVASGVDQLILLHGEVSQSAASVADAQLIFKGSVRWPEVGEEFIV
jgi:ribonuclease Z